MTSLALCESGVWSLIMQSWHWATHVVCWVLGFAVVDWLGGHR